MKGDWKQFVGKVKEKWGKLTDDELKAVEGKRDQISGLIQKKYGMAKEEVDRQLRECECNPSAKQTTR